MAPITPSYAAHLVWRNMKENNMDTQVDATRAEEHLAWLARWGKDLSPAAKWYNDLEPAWLEEKMYRFRMAWNKLREKERVSK